MIDKEEETRYSGNRRHGRRSGNSAVNRRGMDANPKLRN